MKPCVAWAGRLMARKSHSRLNGASESVDRRLAAQGRRRCRVNGASEPIDRSQGRLFVSTEPSTAGVVLRW